MSSSTARIGQRFLGLLLVFLWPATARPYFLGLNTGWARQVNEATRLRWVADTGCRMARVGVRLDLYQQPGGQGHADAAMVALSGQGGQPLAFLFNGGERTINLPDGRPARTLEPAGLDEPVFASGSDQPQGVDRPNAANRWAAFVYGVVKRYDGTTPGLPRVTWFSFWNEPDWLPWPARPTDRTQVPTWPGAGYDRLARLLFVGRTAARAANPAAKVGLQVCFPESLEFLLLDARHPAGANLDFVDYHAYGGDGSDANVALSDGLAPLARRYRELLRRFGCYCDLLCSETGVTGSLAEGRIQRAAVPKTQLVGAALGLVTAQWYALFDTAGTWKQMGLIRNVDRLPADGTGWQPKDGYYSYLTLARLLGADLASGRARFVDEPAVGAAARAVRFDVDGADLLAVWAYDPDGQPERRATVTLPLLAGQQYRRYRWDWCLTGRPGEVLDAGAPAVTVGIDPEYFLAGEPRQCEPVVRPAAPPPATWTIRASGHDPSWPPELAFDGDWDTHWTGGWRQTQPWWSIEFTTPVTATVVRLKLGRLANATAILEVSDDGQVWRAVSAPFAADGYQAREVPLTGRTTSRWWRVLGNKQQPENVSLFEIEIGDRSGRGRP